MHFACMYTCIHACEKEIHFTKLESSYIPSLKGGTMSQSSERRRRRRAHLQTVLPVEEFPAIQRPPVAALPPPIQPDPTPQPPILQPPARDQVLISKRYCPNTGSPQVGVEFRMVDPTLTRRYNLDVTMAEAICDQILTACEQHRDRYGDEWFETQPLITPASPAP